MVAEGDSPPNTESPVAESTFVAAIFLGRPRPPVTRDFLLIWISRSTLGLLDPERREVGRLNGLFTS